MTWTDQRNAPTHEEAGHLVVIERIAHRITERKQAEVKRSRYAACTPP